MVDFYQIPLEDRADKDYLKWEKLNFILRRIFDTIGNVDGRQGPVTNLSTVNMGGNPIQDGPVQKTAQDTDFITKSYLDSAEFGRMIVRLIAATGKTPLQISGSVGTPSSGGGSGGVTDHALLTHLDYATAGHTGFVPAARTISTTAPLTGGGDLSVNRTIAIPQATGAVDGYLSAGDWTIFNNKANALSGTLGKIAKFTSATTIGDSIVKESAGKIGIDTTGAPAYKLEVEGQIKATLGSILPTVKNISIVGGALATDASLANHFRCTVDDDFTLSNVSNPIDGQRIIWEFTQDGTGNWVITLDTKFVVPSNMPDVILSLLPGKIDMLGGIYNVILDKIVITGFMKEYA